MGSLCFATLTGVFATTASAAYAPVDSVLTACAAALAGETRVCALTRPPGHHASRDLIGGGCYLDNAAIAAECLLAGGASPVAIVDVDFHHGNGTESHFYDRSDVFYVSLHVDPARCFPYFSGYRASTGTDQGEGFNLNVPLPPDVVGSAYLSYLAPALEVVASSSAEFILVSLGLDTALGDPSGDVCLLASSIREMGALFHDYVYP